MWTTDRSQPLDTLLRQLNPALKGWCVYFRPSVSSRTFANLRYYTWRRVGNLLRRKPTAASRASPSRRASSRPRVQARGTAWTGPIR